MSYIVLTFVEPGKYIPKHDPSFVHDTHESAMIEVKHDLKAYGEKVALYKLDSTFDPS